MKGFYNKNKLFIYITINFGLNTSVTRDTFKKEIKPILITNYL